MNYILDFTDDAKSDLKFHKKSGNKAILKKIVTFLEEITEHPFSGTGKPEPLKYDLSGKWSRRINQEHRLVYEVLESIVKVHSAKGHYE
jgi:toxin YoeB